MKSPMERATPAFREPTTWMAAFSFTDHRVRVSGMIADQGQADDLVKFLQAIRPFLPAAQMDEAQQKPALEEVGWSI